MPFPWVLGQKVNLIALLEFELAYYNVAVERISYNTTMISPLCVCARARAGIHECILHLNALFITSNNFSSINS